MVELVDTPSWGGGGASSCGFKSRLRHSVRQSIKALPFFYTILNTLKRGYAIVRKDDKVISDISDVKNDDVISVNLEKGTIVSKVLEVK